MAIDSRQAYSDRLATRQAELRVLVERDRRLSIARGIVGGIALVALIALGWVRSTWLALGLSAVGSWRSSSFTSGRRGGCSARAGAWPSTKRARAPRRVDRQRRAGRALPDPQHPYAADSTSSGAARSSSCLCDGAHGAGRGRARRLAAAPAAPAIVRARQAAPSRSCARASICARTWPCSARTSAAPSTRRRSLRGRPRAPVAGAARPCVACASSPASTAALVGLVAGIGRAGCCRARGAGRGSRCAAWRARRCSAACRHGDRQPATATCAPGRAARRASSASAFETPALARCSGARARRASRPSRRSRRLAAAGRDPRARAQPVLRAARAAACSGDATARSRWRRWRAPLGAAVPRWLDAVGETRGARRRSPATRTSIRPTRFPRSLDGGPPLRRRGARRIRCCPAARAVRNDVRLWRRDLRLLLVSGSNMSGKSTLLRTVGVNAVLAQAGAPVRAARLRLSPLAVGATIRIQDSLQDGDVALLRRDQAASRQVVDLARGPRPVAVPARRDPATAPTRTTGASAPRRSCAALRRARRHRPRDHARPGAGRDRRQPRRRARANVHFEDHLRTGAWCSTTGCSRASSSKSNALALMRAVGLEV